MALQAVFANLFHCWIQVSEKMIFAFANHAIVKPGQSGAQNPEHERKVNTMRKESAMKIFQNILEAVGMKNRISVSKTPNELADLMVYQQPYGSEYLACNGKPLFQFREIRNILYQHGEEMRCHFAGTKLQLVIELQGDASYTLEYGENGRCDAMYLNGAWATEDGQIQELLTQYNRRVRDRDNIQNLVYAVWRMLSDSEVPTEEEQEEISREVKRYIAENPWDKELLFDTADAMMQAMVYDDADLRLTRELMQQIVSAGYEDGLMEYMRREEGQENGVPGYYVPLAAAALRLMREIK